MAMDSTVTEQDMDAATQQLARGFREQNEASPDLSIDGFSESIIGKLLRVFSGRRGTPK